MSFLERLKKKALPKHADEVVTLSESSSNDLINGKYWILMIYFTIFSIYFLYIFYIFSIEENLEENNHGCEKEIEEISSIIPPNDPINQLSNEETR